MPSGDVVEEGMGALALAGSQLRASCSAFDPKAAEAEEKKRKKLEREEY